MRPLPMIATALLVAACADFPELEEANRGLPPPGPPPPLLPFGELHSATTGGAARAASTDDLEARAADLRTRAAIIGQPAAAEGGIDDVRESLEASR